MLGERLAEGGFGVVHRGADAASGAPVAIKLLHRRWLDDPQTRRRFEREAALLTRLDHPHIVRVLEAGCLDGGAPFLVMEWIDGPDLDRVVAARGRLGEREAVAVARAVAAALEVCHRASIVHRDLKGSNLLFPDGDLARAKLIDFGVAKLVAADPASSISSTGAIIGSPQAMAPEQVLGRPVDVRTDVYALGVLLFHMLAGRLPFYSERPEDLEAMHLYSPPPSLLEHVAVTDGCERLVADCLRKDPAARPPDMAAVLARLASLE